VIVMMFYGYGGHMGGVGWVFMALSMVVFWGLVIAGIVLLARALTTSRPGSASTPPPSAEELLAQRYARGEIDTGQYQARLDTLHGSRPPAGTT
jgi:putative membrane protein